MFLNRSTYVLQSDDSDGAAQHAYERLKLKLHKITECGLEVM